MHVLCSYGQTYPYKQFTTNNGLINNRCGNVSQDSAGYIWITSDNGISNYDGRKFTFFPGKNSTYYFAHTNTINMYKGQCVFATDKEGFALGLANNLSFHSPPSDQPAFRVTYGLILNDSTTLVAKVYTTDIEMISGGRKTILNPPVEIARKMKSFLMFLKDVEGNIWVGTDAGIYIYKKGDLNDPYILPDLLGSYCNVLKTDFEGNIFIACERDVYKIFREHLKDLTNAQPVKFATHKEEITAMGLFRNGDIMVSDLPDGIAIYNKALQLKKKISKRGLPDVVLWDIFVDREENIWLATQNGVYRFKNFDFVNYTPSNVSGSPNIISGVAYNDKFLFSNGIDVFSIENEEIKTISHTTIVNNYDVRLLVTPGNTIWLNRYINYSTFPNRITRVAAMDNGVLKIKKNTIFNDVSPAADLERAVAINKKEIAFLNLNKKLFIYQDGKIKKIILPLPLDTLNFNAIAKGFNENEIVLAVNKTGFFYCKIENNNDGVVLRVIEKIIFDNDLKNDRCIKVITAKNKTIWLATRNNGIRIFSKPKNNYTLYKTLTEPDISSSMITELMQDSAGNIWVGSNKGIDKITIAPQNNFIINKGLYNNLMNGSLVYFLKEHNKKLYIGTTGSLSTIDINAKLSSIIPFVHISHLTVNNNNVDSLLSAGSHIFSPNQNNLTFEFVSPTFIDEQATEYQYQLEGIDKDWSNPGSNYIIAYSQLPAGNYTFRVRAKNANSVWSLTDASFNFTIKKPFYKHWLFALLCAFVIVAVCYWLYKQKMNRIIAVERTRRSISKDLHDDIGTTLSSITLMNAVLKNKIESQPEEAKKMAAKIENTSRDMIQNMSDIVWSINPNNDTMEKLIYRLQQFCSDVFDKPGIQYQFKIDEEIKSKVLNMQLRRDIYLICKEIINNAAKYSQATIFNLTLSLKQKTILLTASDNGIGFNEKTVNKGNGLMNIRQRVNTYNGEVSLTSDNGTTWHITIPT